MIIGVDAIPNQVFRHKIPHTNIYAFKFMQGLLDHIYIDEDTKLQTNCEKPTTWRYSTILNANLNNNLEAGSVQAEGMEIDTIKIQKRRSDELEWEDLFTISYDKENENEYYEFLDKYIQNDYEYQYSIVPSSQGIEGERVLSKDVLAFFEGAFLTDINHNYHLFYNFDVDEVNHEKPSEIIELKGRQYPIVTYGQANYTTFDVEAMYIAQESLKSDKQVEIRLEHKGRNELIDFLQNGKPKIYRDMHGQLKLVTVLSETVEYLHPIHAGRGGVSFTVVEIGDVNYENLINYHIHNPLGDTK